MEIENAVEKVMTMFNEMLNQLDPDQKEQFVLKVDEKIDECLNEDPENVQVLNAEQAVDEIISFTGSLTLESENESNIMCKKMLEYFQSKV